MRTVAIVSPHFPPSTLAGVHRARHLAKHLSAHGWRPIVVRVAEEHYTEPGDPALAALLPNSIEQVRVRALPAALTQLAGVGDVGVRGYFPLRAALQRVAATQKPDLVLITGSPFYPMMLSRWVWTSLRLPVVLDFQDPWVSVHGATHPKWSKGGMAHRLAVALEPRAVRHASAITSVSEQQNMDMAARYSWLDPSRMAAIPIGGDPQDFDALRSSPLKNPIVRLDPAKINLSFVGAFMPRTEPLARIVLRALATLKNARPDAAQRLRVHFVGTSNRPEIRDWFQVQPIADEEGVGELVIETPQRVPYLEALSILANSQGILLVGSDEPHYTASKIYPALMSGRPFVSLYHEKSSSHQILNAAGGGRALGFNGSHNASTLVVELSNAIFDLATKPAAFGSASALTYSAYTAESVAGAFARVFEKVVKEAH